MNYIKHLTGFFDKVAKDKLLNPTHVSLYISLFQFWNINRFRNPISISRHEIMRISKISSLATYHKCLKLLDSHGYIKYEPSFNPYKGSHVHLFNFSDELKPTPRNERTANSNFEPLKEQVLNKPDTGSLTGSEQVIKQALVPYINNTNIPNDTNIAKGLNGGEQAQENENVFNFENTDNPKQKSCAKKQKVIIPSLPDILTFFNQQDFPEIEANKFFNYFQSNGWLVGGKTLMTDWQAAARNWMLNIPKFNLTTRTDGTRPLDTSTGKDYSEPL